MCIGGDPAHDTRTTPTNTGVFGRSYSHGVYGITNSINDADTPDFTKVSTSPGSTFAFRGAGVVGVSNSTGPAVLADNGIIGVNVGLSVPLRQMCNGGKGIGVASISTWGPAMFGLCCGSVASPDPLADPDVDRIINEADSRPKCL